MELVFYTVTNFTIIDLNWPWLHVWLLNELSLFHQMLLGSLASNE